MNSNEVKQTHEGLFMGLILKEGGVRGEEKAALWGQGRCFWQLTI